MSVQKDPYANASAPLLTKDAATQTDPTHSYVAQRNRSIAFWVALNFIPVVGQIATYHMYRRATDKLQDAISNGNVKLAQEAFKEGASRNLSDYLFQNKPSQDNEVFKSLQNSWIQHKPGPIGWNKGVLATLLALTLPTLGLCWIYVGFQNSRLRNALMIGNVEIAKDAISKGANPTFMIEELNKFMQKMNSTTKESFKGVFEIFTDGNNHVATYGSLNNLNSTLISILPLIQYQQMIILLNNSWDPELNKTYFKCWEDHPEAINAFIYKHKNITIQRLEEYKINQDKIKITPKTFIKLLKRHYSSYKDTFDRTLTSKQIDMLKTFTSQWNDEDKKTALSLLIKKGLPNYWEVIDPNNTVKADEETFNIVSQTYGYFAWENTPFFHEDYITEKTFRNILQRSATGKNEKISHLFSLMKGDEPFFDGKVNRSFLQELCENLNDNTLQTIYENHRERFTKEQVVALFEFAVKNRRFNFASAIISNRSEDIDLYDLAVIACKYYPKNVIIDNEFATKLRTEGVTRNNLVNNNKISRQNPLADTIGNPSVVSS